MKTGRETTPEAACFRLATAYLARRAASKLHLRRYLLRKLDAVETDDGERLDAQAIVEAVLVRLEQLQLIDETSLAQSRALTLARKGYSGRRLRAHLAHQGFDVADPAIVTSLAIEDDAQAVRYAERKRLGPFAAHPGRSTLERDVRSLVRAGFATDLALRVMTQLRRTMPAPVETEAPDVNEP